MIVFNLLRTVTYTNNINIQEEIQKRKVELESIVSVIEHNTN